MSFVFIKEDFFIFINNFSYCNLLITNVKYLKCSSSVLMKTNISSGYTITKLPMKYFNTSFINLIKVIGEFFKPNGITNHSYVRIFRHLEVS